MYMPAAHHTMRDMFYNGYIHCIHTFLHIFMYVPSFAPVTSLSTLTISINPFSMLSRSWVPGMLVGSSLTFIWHNNLIYSTSPPPVSYYSRYVFFFRWLLSIHWCKFSRCAIGLSQCQTGSEICCKQSDTKWAHVTQPNSFRHPGSWQRLG